jgi:hypothetical protein
MRLALEVLRDAEPDGIGCFLFGQAVMPDRTGRRSSVNGGGDYAAQMYLGRLRKLGLARTLVTEGSSRWVLTNEGRGKLSAYVREERSR